MPARHYRRLLRELFRTRMLRLQGTVLFLTTAIDWVLMPFLTKLEGTHLPVFMISFYMLLGASDGFIQPLFRQVKIYRIYAFVIVLDLVQIAAYMLEGVDIVLFTYVMLSLFTLQAITFEISRVHTIDFMQDEMALKDYLMLRSLIVSAAIITGSLAAMLFDALDVPLGRVLILLAVLGLVAVVIEYRLFAKFRRIVQNDETVITRQKNLVNEKINV
jgi:hypothetical protein